MIAHLGFRRSQRAAQRSSRFAHRYAAILTRSVGITALSTPLWMPQIQGAHHAFVRLAYDHYRLITDQPCVAQDTPGMGAQTVLTWAMVLWFMFTAVAYVAYRVDIRARRRGWDRLAYQRKRLHAARELLNEENARRSNLDLLDDYLDEEDPDDD